MFRSVNRSRPAFAALVTLLAATLSAIGAAIAAGGIDQNALDRCRAMSDAAARLRCFEDATAVQPQAFQPGPPLTGGWRLVRTPNPQGGKDAVSVIHSADLSGSDPNFAGLMFRCADPTFEIMVVLIRPLPPRARPPVTIDGQTFEGSVVLPGAAILLPPEASLRAKTRWVSLASIQIAVEEDDMVTHGLVPLEGIGGALQTLASTCAAR